jgi:hypothetical protein
MRQRQSTYRASGILAFALAIVVAGCFDGATGAPTGPQASPQLTAAVAPAQAADVAAAIAAQEKYSQALFHIPGVVGTAVGLLPNGQAAVRIYLKSPDVTGLPTALDGIPVAAQVTGMFIARSDPTKKQRPAPVGFSVGHFAITAGTIGGRTLKNLQVFLLSNNHVLANSNDASIGDPEYQPGPFDGGTAADQIGTLADFKPIDFSGANNTIDAAIALVTNSADLSNSTPTDDGYGVPNGTIFDDANSDGSFDDKSHLLGVNVQKYGRTTKLTRGTITAINAELDVCYEVFIIFCVQAAHFVDQIVVDGSGFSAGGDSGSLIVTDDPGKNPVGLLFAGSDTQTILNRIDLVLNYFGVTIDGGAAPPPPPPPANDVAITGVSAPSSVTQGSTVDVVVTIKNVGQNASGSFDVTLRDTKDNVDIGTQNVSGLAAGATTTRTFSWNTSNSSEGTHTLTASHTLADDNVANNQASTNSTVNLPVTPIHVGDLDATPSLNGDGTWSTVVEITIHDANHQPLNGATIVGSWSPNSFLVSNECTSGDLGGTGTCIVLYPSIRKNTKSVTFKVNSVTMSGRTYSQAANHDPDGSSNGTSIKVSRP